MVRERGTEGERGIDGERGRVSRVIPEKFKRRGQRSQNRDAVGKGVQRWGRGSTVQSQAGGSKLQGVGCSISPLWIIHRVLNAW